MVREIFGTLSSNLSCALIKRQFTNLFIEHFLIDCGFETF